MKLLLLYPPDLNVIRGELPEVLQEGIGFVPSVGLLYIAASVKRRTSWDVEFVDCAAEGLDHAQVRERIREARPDAVGITVTNHQLPDCLDICRIVRAVDPKIKILLGGPHVHIYPRETIAFDCVDFVFTGEAEKSVADFLNAWEDPDRWRGVPGIFYKTREGVLEGPPVSLIEDLDALPFPDRRLTRQHLYVSPLTEKKSVTSMITSRGCPFQCTYCARVHFGKKFRARSAGNVVDEMEQCLGLGIEYIRVYDDTFTLDRQRVLDICGEIRRRNLRLRWDIRAHINTIDAEMLRALKASGCDLICYGIESGSDEILKRMKKGITREKAVEVVGMTRKIGIRTLLYFMLGFPGESREQMLETIEFAKVLEPDFCHFAILVPFPRTAIYEEGMAQKMFKGDPWREFAEHPARNFKPPFWVERVPEEEMRALLDRAYRAFYWRPSYLLKRLLALRSWNDFCQKAKTAAHLLRKN